MAGLHTACRTDGRQAGGQSFTRQPGIQYHIVTAGTASVK
jgi:hypothetical protein